ncbi:MAG: transglycosylase SLT domain-containing protein [Deltaproteobacteria bacterium]|nr:transglycosylase SLT domain-containing protein [Deltaproteobacteria bacterium]
MRRLVLVVVSAGMLAACGRLELKPPAPAEIAVPSDRRRAFAEAVELIDHGRFAEAAPRFQVLLRDYPELADYHLHYLGLAQAGSGQAADATATLRRLRSEYPGSVHYERAGLELARAELQLGRTDAARATLIEAARAQAPDVAQQARLELARADLTAGEVAAAAAALLALRRELPAEAIGRQAKTELQRLRASHPELAPSVSSRLDELRILVSERDYGAADKLARELAKDSGIEERAEVARLHTQVLLALGRVDEAVARLRQVARTEAGAAAAATEFRIASILWNRDREAEALAAFTELRRRRPRAPQSLEALYAIGRIHERAGRADRAIAAYRQLTRSAPRHKLAREARWRVGWIKYCGGDWQGAEQSFAALAQCSDTAACADALYWRARVLDHQARGPAARELYRRIVVEAPASYYAMWAEQRLGLAVAASTSPTTADLAGPPAGADYHLLRAAELMAMGLRVLARAELTAYEREHVRDANALRQLLRWYRAADGHSAALRLARQLGDKAGLSANERQLLLYPLGFRSEIETAITAAGRDGGSTPIAPLLVAALIRQESLYDPEARSPADAWGLMQLLPSTAERVAGAPVTTAELREPRRNIALGIRYLSQLLARFGDPLMALAAYNGGESAVEKWQQRFAGRERDEFVESISFRETRDYVKKVITAYRHYQQLYGQAGF